MSVLSRWLKKLDSRRPGTSGRPSPAASVERKPMESSPDSKARPGYVDQAARLREAVVATETDDAPGDNDLDIDLLTNSPEPAETPEPPFMSDAESEDLPVEPEAETDHPALTRKPKPRNKQELIEELHRNYQEVLGLVRKLDTHLDQGSDRAETMTAIAEEYRELAPIIASLPDRFRGDLAQLGSDVQSTIEREGSASRQLLERIETAIISVGADMERSTNQQGQLVQTMSEFRDSLTDLSRASTAACETVRDFEGRAAKRDEALLAQLRQTRLWLIGLTIGGGVFALAAIVLATLVLSGVWPG